MLSSVNNYQIFINLFHIVCLGLTVVFIHNEREEKISFTRNTKGFWEFPQTLCNHLNLICWKKYKSTFFILTWNFEQFSYVPSFVDSIIKHYTKIITSHSSSCYKSQSRSNIFETSVSCTYDWKENLAHLAEKREKFHVRKILKIAFRSREHVTIKLSSSVRDAIHQRGNPW